MWVRGLKLDKAVNRINDNVSHPMWVRGLKQDDTYIAVSSSESHPMWVRGLKHVVLSNLVK